MNARAEKAIKLLRQAEERGPGWPVQHQQMVVAAAQVQATLAVVEALDGVAAAIDQAAAR